MSGRTVWVVSWGEAWLHRICMDEETARAEAAFIEEEAKLQSGRSQYVDVKPYLLHGASDEPDEEEPELLPDGLVERIESVSGAPIGSPAFDAWCVWALTMTCDRAEGKGADK